MRIWVLRAAATVAVLAPLAVLGGAILSLESQSEMPNDSPSTEPSIAKTDAEWREQLSAEQYYVARQKGTERAFTGEFWNHHDEGVYTCVCCGAPLFSSGDKFDSGTGWPSYTQPVSDDSVETEEDRSWFSVRTEVHCRRCDAHLGHVFPDGPKPTGLRYCINSASLGFQDSEPE